MKNLNIFKYIFKRIFFRRHFKRLFRRHIKRHIKRHIRKYLIFIIFKIKMNNKVIEFYEENENEET